MNVVDDKPSATGWITYFNHQGRGGPMTRRSIAIATLLLMVALTTSAAAPRQLMAAPPSPPAGAAPVLASRTQIYIGQGFDTCEIPSFDALQEWITHSPYGAVNLYIGGSGRFCSNRALTAAFLTRLAGIGWKFIPTWVGPQAPCYTGNKPRMSADPAISNAEGAAEADAAVGVATGLGLAEADGSGTIIYYDMEHYDTGNTACNEAARSFISGWTGRLRSRGNLVGVYGKGAALSGFVASDNVPDAVWAAEWIRPFSYLPDITVWDIPNLSNTLWVNQQRMRQYAGGHAETWGGVTLNIDCNVIDGIVASIPPPDLPFKAYLPAILNGVENAISDASAP